MIGGARVSAPQIRLSFAARGEWRGERRALFPSPAGEEDNGTKIVVDIR
jgi:hypothetical protein